MSKSEIVIPKEIIRLDQAIRAGKPVEPKKLDKGSDVKAAPEAAGKSAYRGIKDGGFDRVARSNASIVGRNRFAATAESVIKGTSMAERAAALIERLPRKERGQYLAHVVTLVYKDEAPKLNFRKDE